VPRSMAGVALVAPAQQGDDDWTVSNRQLIEPGGEGCWPVDPPLALLCPDKKVFAAMPPMRYTEMHTVEYRQPPQFVWAWDPLFYTCPACDG
jgi:hypothetical protein